MTIAIRNIANLTPADTVQMPYTTDDIEFNALGVLILDVSKFVEYEEVDSTILWTSESLAEDADTGFLLSDEVECLRAIYGDTTEIRKLGRLCRFIYKCLYDR